ncbi:MAG: hypothetical protein HYX87_09295 [Chloroflexi bacterium]|nr:hypothetical protein [Chloroflexota bacterium]
MAHGLILGGFLLYLLFLAGPLFDRFQAVPDEARLVRLQLPDETSNILYSLDKLVVSPSALEIQGWAFMEGQDYEGSRTYVVLRSDKETYVFDTSSKYTPHVTNEYGEQSINLDWSGFIATIPVRTLERENYTIGFYITRDGSEALRYSTTIVAKSRNKDVEIVDATSSNL